MVPILQAMMKTLYILEFQNPIQILLLIITTLHYETFSTIKKPKSTFTPELTSAIDVLTNSKLSTHCSKSKPFYDTSFFKNRNNFEGFFLPGDYTLDHKTLQQQNSRSCSLQELWTLGYLVMKNLIFLHP